MSEIPKTDFVSSPGVRLVKYSAGESISGGFGMASHYGKSESDASDGFVSLDVGSLSLLATSAARTGESDSSTNHRAPFLKTLSRKGSQGRGETSAADSTTAIDGGNSALVVHVSGDGDFGTLPLATSPTAGVAGGAARYRRLGVRRPSPWLDPRRVVVFFATLSSMGTLILLYFTLSMGRMEDGDANAG
ncbi:hypothetical protein AXF42_Ash011002 [Apostasia shenzhenica]|uniref:Uncharacterized protein n=1 Tax=Apostasia shenzhenica TaxID=1088818 RepID=A0A2H9ZQU6_9ASPA|nr:hypothetical protein AXF42_Ash011002 [Apostasia shenzhenica]